jgi:hypothetical protein
MPGSKFKFTEQDDFIQHLQISHAPFAIRKGIAKANSKLQLEWEAHIEEMVALCVVIAGGPVKS